MGDSRHASGGCFGFIWHDINLCELCRFGSLQKKAAAICVRIRRRNKAFAGTAKMSATVLTWSMKLSSESN
jgi:hypothetical protein